MNNRAARERNRTMLIAFRALSRDELRSEIAATERHQSELQGKLALLRREDARRGRMKKAAP